MANFLHVDILRDGARNMVIAVTGILDTGDIGLTTLVDYPSLNPLPTDLRLDSVLWAIEDGLTCMLWWEASPNKLIFPLAGRSRFDLDWLGGYVNTGGATRTGNVLFSTQGWSGVKHFSIILDFSKQGV